MRWWIALHPHYENPENSMVDQEGFWLADVVYTYYMLVDWQMPNILKYAPYNKILVVHAENIMMEDKEWIRIAELLRMLAENEVFERIIVTGASATPLKVVAITNLRPKDLFFPLWVGLPHAYAAYQRRVALEWEKFLIGWAYSENKGLNEMRAAQKAGIPLEIHDYTNSFPARWTSELLRCRGVAWAAKSEGTGRTIVTAGMLGKPVVMLRTGAMSFSAYQIFDTTHEFFHSTLICTDVNSWIEMLKLICWSKEKAQVWGVRFHNFFEKYEEFWKWEIVDERFRDVTGLEFPKDMTPLHNLSENYWSKEVFDDPTVFPRGAWSNRPLSLNWEG